MRKIKNITTEAPAVVTLKRDYGSASREHRDYSFFPWAGDGAQGKPSAASRQWLKGVNRKLII
jgi:hypothetical protein